MSTSEDKVFCSIEMHTLWWSLLLMLLLLML